MSNNTIDILASINKGVQFIVEHMSPQNSSEKQISKLNRGGAELVRDNGGDAPKAELKVDSVKNIIAALNAMSPAILNIANLSGRQQKRFKNVMKTVVDVMDMMNAAGERYGDSENLKKMLDSLSKSFTIVDKVLKQMSVWTVLGPVAVLGGIMAIPAFVMIGLLFKLIGAMGINKDTAKAFDDMSNAFNKMTGVILKMTLITVLLMGLGYILLNADTSKFILGGLIMFTGVMLATIGVMLLTGLASKLVKDFAFNALKDMMVLILGMTLIMGVFYLFGAFMDNVWETVGKGLLLFGGVCIAMLMVIGLAALASKFITDSKGIKSLGLMYVYIFASMGVIIAAKYLGDFINGEYEKIAAGLISTGLVLVGIMGIAWIASKFKSTVMQGVLAIGLVAIIAFAAMGIIWGALKLSEAAEGKWIQITLTLVAVTGILTLFAGLAFAASYIAPAVLAGSIALASVSLFVISAIFTVKQIIDFHKAKEESGVSWGDVYENVFGLSGVMGVFGVLAAAIGMVAPFVLLGTASSALLILFVMSAVNITKQIISLRQVIAENNTDWNAISADVKELSTVIGIFGLVASAMSLAAPFILLGTLSASSLILFVMSAVKITESIVSLRKTIVENNTDWKAINKDVTELSKIVGIFGAVGSAMSLALPFVLLGLASVATISSFANKAISIAAGVANLKMSIDKAGGYQSLVNTIKVDIKKILGAFTYDNLELPLSVWDVLKLYAQYESIGALTSAFVRVGSDISKLARIVGVVDDQGRIAPVLSIDENTGEIIYGEYADIKAIAKTITDTVVLFTTNLNTGLKDVTNMQATKEVVQVMGSLISPIATFAEALTKYDVDDEGKLAQVSIDENGKIKIGQYVDIKKVASSISSAVTLFVKEIFSKDNTKHWEEIVYGDEWWGEDEGFTATKAALGVLASVISPITEFVELITQLEAKDGKIRRIEYDDKGNIKGEFVDLKAVATSIAGAVTTFATTLFSDKNMAALNSAEKFNSAALNNIVSVVKTMSDLSKVDSKKIDSVSKDFTKSLSVVNKGILDIDPTATEFSKTILKLKDSIFEFDKVLSDEKGNRKKHLNELKEGIEDLLKAFSTNNSTVSNITSLLSKLEKLDTKKINDKVKDLKLDFDVSGGSGGTGNTVKSLSQEEVVEAIKDALDGMLLFQQTMKRTIDGKDGSVVHYRFEPDSE